MTSTEATTGRPAGADERTRLATVIQAALEDVDVPFERVDDKSFLVTLAGEHKLRTMTWLIIGDHTLTIEAFFMRRPAENVAGTYAFLLGRNARTYGVHFSVDRVGDIFLTGQLPFSAINGDEIDTVLGCVRSYADENFDPAIALGFAGAIEREKAWRAKIGDSGGAARMSA